MFERLRRLARRVLDAVRPTPNIPPPPPTPPTPPPTPPGIGVGDGGGIFDRSGFPPDYMGPAEADQFRIALLSLPRPVAQAILADEGALWGYHMAYFGFKGDGAGNDEYPRRDLDGFRREFLDYMFRTYAWEFELDAPIDWDLLRAISGAEAPGL